MFDIRKYKFDTEWTLSTNGKTAFASYGGKRYFIKEYNTPVYPSREMVENGTLSEKAYNKNKRRFDKFLELRTIINTRLGEIAGSGGSIICPVEWGLGESRFVEVSEFVDGLITDRTTIAALSEDNKKNIMLTAIKALMAVHKKGIIHGDIKFGNVTVSLTPDGKYVGKLIDFDCSYLYENKPSAVGGDQSYMSPEVIMCWKTEMSPKYIDKLDYKADIFSFGVLFHEYLTGELPALGEMPSALAEADRSKVDYGVYILYGGKPMASKRIKDKNLALMIEQMLALDPASRPTAQEVFQTIKGEAKPRGSVSDDSVSGGTSGGTVTRSFETPWEEHGISYVESELVRMKFVGCKRVEVAGKKAYEFHRDTGAKRIYTKEQLIGVGLAKVTGASGSDGTSGSGTTGGTSGSASGSAVTRLFETPWEEHGISYVESELARMKFVECKRVEVAGKKAYEFYRENGTKRIYTKEQMVSSGLAKKN